MDQHKIQKAYLMKQKKRLHEQVALASQLYKNLTIELALVEDDLKLMEPQAIKSIKPEQKVTVVIKDKTIPKSTRKSFKESYCASISDDVKFNNLYTEEFSKIRIQ